MSLTIKTNNHSRPLLTRWEVPADVLAREFEWTDPEDPGSFFRYRGVWYELSEFMRAPDHLPGWDGFHSDSAFSGVAVRLAEDCDSVVCALILS